jgi:UDP-hydrolysing UDP-N-acetyl-D-glucosamine 2-epimerase
VQGGEVSGSIDESARHAISKFAQFHVPATRRAAEYLMRMGERPDTILTVGCPSSDIARVLDTRLSSEVVNGPGSGALIDVDEPFLLVVFHPTTTEYGDERRQMDEMLAALEELARPTILLWPNIDAGADHISKAIRVFRTKKRPAWLRTLTNLTPENYLRVLAKTACAIGNSSSFVRDAGYFGTPVVLTGDRQRGRETDEHVLRARPLASNIVPAVRRQLLRGRFAPSRLYGDGYVSERIATALSRLSPYLQKTLHYISEEKMAAAAGD